MQKIFIAFLCACATLSAGFAQQTPPSNPPAASAKPGQSSSAAAQSSSNLNQKDKFSYALGMNLGTNLHKTNVEVNPDMVLQGLKDSLAGSKTLITEDEGRAAIMEVQNQVRKQLQEKAQKEGEENQKAGEAFLAANKSKEGVVTLPSGLQYKVLQGGVGPKPTASDSVVCNYKGTLINGTEFDSSAKHGGPATFPVSGVIKGWTEALQLMPVGSKWQLFVPPQLAYGERGAGGDIGPNETLIFEVELVSIKPKAEEKKPEEKKPEEKK
jgi:FKBP-type peptidyl-prolyl cis-trans isomerase FklB